MNRSPIALVVAVAAVATLATVPAHAQYKILDTVKIGGEGGWDYLTADPANRNLYIARSGPAGHILVFNMDTLKQVADIPGVSGHGAAVDDASGHAFATSKPVTMIDAKTFSVMKKVEVQGNPDGYLNDPMTHHFYVLSHSAPNVTVLNDADGSVVGTIDLGGAPEQAALDGKGKMFVDLEDKDAIAVVDTKTMKKVGQYDISSKGGGCAGLAMDTVHGILFAACRDKKNMIILSAADGKIITALPTGDGVDGTAINPQTLEVFATAGDGTLTIIKETPGSGPLTEKNFAVEQTVTTPVRARTITFDPKTGHVFTVTAQYGPAAAPTAAIPRPRPPMLPDSFELLVIGK